MAAAATSAAAAPTHLQKADHGLQSANQAKVEPVLEGTLGFQCACGMALPVIAHLGGVRAAARLSDLVRRRLGGCCRPLCHGGVWGLQRVVSGRLDEQFFVVFFCLSCCLVVLLLGSVGFRVLL